jgi:hypothetical protein
MKCIAFILTGPCVKLQHLGLQTERESQAVIHLDCFGLNPPSRFARYHLEALKLPTQRRRIARTLEAFVYELLVLTKSGREIVVGRAATTEEAKQLSESATQLLGGLKVAQERNDVVVVQSDENVYWILPTEIEGLSLYRVPDGEAQGASTFGIVRPS